MKRFLCCALVLILGFNLCGCSSMYVFLEERLNPTDTVIVLTASLPEDFSDLDTTALKEYKSEFTYQCTATETAAEQYRAFCAAAKKPNTAALVVELSSRVYAEAMVETAKEAALPLIFCGKKPELSVLEQYDNCWYVGFKPELAAELQAELIVNAFRTGQLADQSGDFKLNTLTVIDSGSVPYLPNGYADEMMRNIELAGVHLAQAADPVLAADMDSLYKKLDALLLPQQDFAEGSAAGTEAIFETTAPLIHTEIILCGDTTASAASIQLLSALEAAAADETLAAFATPARPYYIACYGINDAIETAVRDGTLLGAVGKDTAACTQAVFTLCENLARKEAITKNNDYYFEDGKCLMLDYRVIAAATEAE